MNAKAWKRRGSSAAIAAAAVTALSNAGFAQQVIPVIDQTFNEGGYTFHDIVNGNADVGAYVTPPAGNNQLLSWYQGGGTDELSFVQDPDMGSGNSLDKSAPSGADGIISSGAFPTTATLGSNVGDELTFGFTFRLTDPGSVNSTTDFRFGLFNNNGSPIQQPFGTYYQNTTADWYGISAYLGVGTNYLTVSDEPNANPGQPPGSLGNGVLKNNISVDYLLAQTSTAPDIGDGNAHSVLFTLTNDGPNEVNIAFAVDGVTYFSGLDTNPTPPMSFNEIAMHEIKQSINLELGNIQVNEINPSLTLAWDNAGASSPADGQTWDTVNNNWNNGAAATTYTDGSAIVFNDTNNGNYAVVVNTTVNPGSITVNNSAGNYSVIGSGKIVSTGTFTKAGTGTFTIGTALTASSLSISAGTIALGTGASAGTRPAATSAINLSSLTITGSGQLDIANNHIIINYGASDPISQIQSYIASGYNNGAWNGPGIVSSAARHPGTSVYGVGFADGSDGIVSGLSSGQIEVAYTLLGDANLDGVVNGSDFSILAANFGQGHTNWDQGDFLFTPAVNGSDFSALAANFGQGDNGAAVQVSTADIAALDAFAAANGLSINVPEPVSAGLLAGATIVGLTRRRRHQNQKS